jgi:hypothetical protein
MKKLNNNRLKYSILLLAVSSMSLHGATVVPLGTAGNYAILAKSGISTTGTTSITGDIGISPIADTAFTGFGQTLDGSGVFATSALVTGKMYASNYAVPTPSILSTAVSDMETAYNDAAGRSGPSTDELGAGNLNGETLNAGLYTWTSALTITDSITFNGGGDFNSVWILQVENRLTLADSAQIILSGGAQANNIFWQTAEGATLGTNSQFAGILLTATDIAVQTGASVDGNLYAQTAVTLDSNNIVQSIPEPSSTVLLVFGMTAFLSTRRRNTD